MTIALVASTYAVGVGSGTLSNPVSTTQTVQAPQSDGYGGCGGSINTTGANLLVAVIAYHYANSTQPVVTDSAGNTWIQAGGAQYVQSTRALSIYYCLNPTTSGTHNFQMGGSTYGSSSTGIDSADAIYVMAFSGVASYDTITGQGYSAGTSATPGSQTPGMNGALIITGISGNGGSGTPTGTAVSGYTLDNTVMQGNQVSTNAYLALGGAAYLIQSTAAATNPGWSWATATAVSGVCAAAIFYPTTGSPNVNLTGAAITSAPAAFGTNNSKPLSGAAISGAAAAIVPGNSVPLSGRAIAAGFASFGPSLSKSLAAAIATAAMEPFATLLSVPLGAAAGAMAAGPPASFTLSVNLQSVAASAIGLPFQLSNVPVWTPAPLSVDVWTPQ